MPFDGIFMSHVCRELRQAVGTRIEKIYQPSRDELVLTLGGRDFDGRLLISVSGVGPRVHFTHLSFDNPATPPMLCMLMRKRFTNARLESVMQRGLDRVLTLEFSAFNELGDSVRLAIIAEIMGRQSNVIMTCDGRIIDALRRSDPESEGRLVLPGARYVPPAAQDKMSVLESDDDAVLRAVEADGASLDKALSHVLDGVSPLVAREVALDASTAGLPHALSALRERAQHGAPTLVVTDGAPADFTYMPVAQYGSRTQSVPAASYSELLDDFYRERQQTDDIRRRTHDLTKLVNSLIERTSRKLEKQRGELARCADKEQLRIYGELLKANLFAVERGAPFAEVPNYYDPEYKPVRIPLKPELSPSANAQRYFKEYRKANTAEDMLAGLIKSGEGELDYLGSVLDELTRAQSARELSEIRAELTDSGYIRAVRGSRKAQKALPPLHFLSSDGFDIWVGRNNKQNDELTLRVAAKTDVWLHTKGVHGTHTIVSAGGCAVPEPTLMEAASLAAYHSNARQSAQVAVDYCPVRNVRKPNGARAGMVIYDNYNTVYVTPDRELCERLAVKTGQQ